MKSYTVKGLGYMVAGVVDERRHALLVRLMDHMATELALADDPNRRPLSPKEELEGTLREQALENFNQ
jgi:hypothetical protein